MPKPTKYATLICTIASIIAVIGIIIGIIFKYPLVIVLLLLPAAIYEAYRTEGPSTKWASWFMIIILIALAVLIIFNINYDMASFFGREYQYVSGYTVPLGDIKVVAPVLLAITSIILFVRTYGVYTKWLAVVIFISAFAIIYALDASIFKQVVQLVSGEMSYRSYY